MPTTGCGVYTKRRGTPWKRRSSAAKLANSTVEIGAVGIPYSCSSVREQEATATAQPGQPATPKIAALPLSLISAHRSLVSSRKILPVFRRRTVLTEGMCWVNHEQE